MTCHHIEGFHHQIFQGGKSNLMKCLRTSPGFNSLGHDYLLKEVDSPSQNLGAKELIQRSHKTLDRSVLEFLPMRAFSDTCDRCSSTLTSANINKPNKITLTGYKGHESLKYFAWSPTAFMSIPLLFVELPIPCKIFKMHKYLIVSIFL